MKNTFALFLVLATTLSGCAEAQPPVADSPSGAPAQSITPSSPSSNPTTTQEPVKLPRSVPEIDITTLLISNKEVLPFWWLSTERFKEFNGSMGGWGRNFSRFARPNESYPVGNFENGIFIYRNDGQAHEVFLELRRKYKDVVTEPKELGDESFLVKQSRGYRLGGKFMAFRIANAVVTIDIYHEAGLDVDSLAKTVERRVRLAMGGAQIILVKPLSYPQHIESKKLEKEAEYKDSDGFLVKGKVPGMLTTSVVGWSNTWREYWGIFLDSGTRPRIISLKTIERGTPGKDFDLYSYVDSIGGLLYESKFTPSVRVEKIISNPASQWSSSRNMADELRNQLYGPTLEAWSYVLGTPVSMPEFSDFSGADFHGIPTYPESTELKRILMPPNSADNLEFKVKGPIVPTVLGESPVSDWYHKSLLSQGWIWAQWENPFPNVIQRTYYRDGDVVTIQFGETVRLVYWSPK